MQNVAINLEEVILCLIYLKDLDMFFGCLTQRKPSFELSSLPFAIISLPVLDYTLKFQHFCKDMALVASG